MEFASMCIRSTRLSPPPYRVLQYASRPVECYSESVCRRAIILADSCNKYCNSVTLWYRKLSVRTQTLIF